MHIAKAAVERVFMKLNLKEVFNCSDEKRYVYILRILQFIYPRHPATPQASERHPCEYFKILGLPHSRSRNEIEKLQWGAGD